MTQTDLREVFSLPRNKHTHPQNRGAVGGYLYQKIGRSGLPVAMQDFDHELPIAELAMQMGENMVRETKNFNVL